MNHTTRFALSPANWALAIACVAILASAAPAQNLSQRPAQDVAGPPSPSTSTPIQVHAIIGANAKGVAAKLKEIYGGYPNLLITDTIHGQIVVQGPPPVQQEIAHWLATEGVLSDAPPRPAAAEPVAFTQPQTSVTTTWRLKNLTARDFENKLLRTWGNNLQSSQDQIGDVATFRFPPTAAGTTSIVVDRRAATATITLPRSSAASWERLMATLDSRPRSPAEQTAIKPLLNADINTIRRAVAILTQVFSSDEPRRKSHIGQFVSMLFQQALLAQVGAQPAGGAQPPALPPGGPLPAPGAPGVETAAQPLTPGAPSIASMEAIARINNVQIEILEDVIVVRGRKEDVDRVLQIIEQIEQQSLQFKPAIEIYYLKHIDSTALSDMINQVYAAAFARLGTVTIQPLQRPNAVLLIGRKENIPSLIELISKLDVPAPADGERRIFHLEHMSAIDMERTIRTFFVTRPPTDTTLRPGLGTRALVIADYRSNSLIVQAAPRDMVEVTKLITELDVPTAAVNYEIRVFKLRNSIAETLATVLEESITAAAASTTATAAVGAATQGTAARATPPAVSLQFERFGPEGAQLIKSGIVANVRVNADTRTNSLIIVGPTTAMGLMAALVEQLDTLPASVARIKVFNIRNGDATALAEMLTNLFGQPQQANQQAPGQVSPTGQGESAIVPLRFSVDQRTNSIIATGNEGDLNVIYHILTRLDEGDIRTRKTSVYRLRNAPAQDVANALTNLLTQNLALIQSAPELVTPVETLDRQVIVVPEIVTNSLIVSATERYFNEITKIIETLDKRPPMVVIQVVLAEVTLSDTEQFGVEWGLQDALMFDRGIPAGAGAALAPGFNFNSAPLTLPNQNSATSLATAPRVATQGLSNLALGRTDPTLGFGGLVLSASSESVNVLLRALEASSRAQIISRPQVQTLDNLPAFVQVGALVPRITGAATTGLSVVPILNDINVGLILQVTPRVSLDGTIAMQVYAEKSSVGPDATGIPVTTDANGNVIRSPQIPRTLAQTTVLSRSGQTIVLGGLITNDQEEESRRVPYLADIPVIGRLFRFDFVTKKRTELLIIMTPYLVTSEDQIDWINARESERMSWCVADIVNIHGPVPLGGNPAFNAGPTPLIFPDLQPGGLPPNPTLGPTGPPGTPGYPGGPMPYGEIPILHGRGNVQSVLPNLAPPGPGVPGVMPPGPMPYAEPMRTPTPAVPPPPPPGPGGLGSSRRTSEPYLVPQPPSLMQPPVKDGQSGLAPPTVQPAAPPVGTGVTPVANFQPYPPLPQSPSSQSPPSQPPPAQQMMPLPPTGGVAPAEYQQAPGGVTAAQYQYPMTR